MNELFLIIPISVFSVLLLFIIPYNCIKARGSNRRIVHIGNIVVGSVILCVFAARMVYRASVNKDINSFDVYNMECEKADNGHYILYNIISYDPDLYPPSVAVQNDKVESSPFFESYHGAVVYVQKNKQIDTGNERIISDGHEYVVSDTVFKVVPDHHELRFSIFCYAWLVLFIFNSVELLIVLYYGARRKKNEYYNDF